MEKYAITIKNLIFNKKKIASMLLAGALSFALVGCERNVEKSEEIVEENNFVNFVEDNSEKSLKCNVLDINGTEVPWIYNWSCMDAPSTGCAIWDGFGFTTDNQGTWFVGKNPGDFACAYDLEYGDPITFYDENGDSKTYYVCDIFDTSQNGTVYFGYKDETVATAGPETQIESVGTVGPETQIEAIITEDGNILPRIYPGGETIALQSGDPVNEDRIRLTIAR